MNQAHPRNRAVAAAIFGCRIARSLCAAGSAPEASRVWKRDHDVGSVLWPGRQDAAGYGRQDACRYKLGQCADAPP